MGFWGLGIVVAPIFGPVFGGWVTENYSWRWVFYINLPVGIVSLIMTQLYVFDPPYLKRESSGIDYWGMGLLVVGIGALQFVLDKGQQEDWFASTMITTLAIISAVGLIALIVQQLMSKEPIIDLLVYRPHTPLVFPDDGARLRAVRQPGAAADHAADAVRLSLPRRQERRWRRAASGRSS